MYYKTISILAKSLIISFQYNIKSVYFFYSNPVFHRHINLLLRLTQSSLATPVDTARRIRAPPPPFFFLRRLAYAERTKMAALGPHVRPPNKTKLCTTK